MEVSTVELKIDWEWLVWAGCRKDYGTSLPPFRDPMDQDNFDELVAFPSIKPNFDVLRPPHRSRKQRGWYQIKRWPPLPPALLTDTGIPPVRATAANIPPELFERVIEGFHPLNDKRAFSQCGLVCRYWAGLCRERLFLTLRIRSQQDGSEFCAFDRDPACQFFRYFPEIDITVQNMAEPPWIHWMSQTRYNRLFWLSFTGPVKLPAGCKMFRSIHQGLPRTPPTFSRHVRRLVLKDVHFTRLDDLMHLVRELPHSEELFCERVTWDVIRKTLPRRHTSVNAMSKRTRPHVKLWQCSPTSPQASVLLMDSFANSILWFFFRADLSCLLMLIETLDIFYQWKAVVTEEENLFVTVVREKSIPLHHDPLGGGDVTILLGLRNVVSITVKAHPQPAAEGIASFHVQVVAVKLDSDKDYRTRFDWSAFDAAISSFSSVRAVVFGLNSTTSVLAFVEEIAGKKMPLLSRRGVCRYAVWDEKSHFWCGVSSNWEVNSRHHVFDLADAY